MKKFVKWTIGLTAGMLVLVIGFMVALDPLFQYHLPWFGLKPIVTSNEQYYVPGMAKTFEYENAIVGTSMSENFRPSWINELYGGKTAKLTIAGSNSKEYQQVLNLILNRKGTTNIVMNIDRTYLQSIPNGGRWEDLPDYLYNNNYLDDVNYVLNKSMILEFGQKMIKRNKNGEYTDFDEIFIQDQEKTLSVEDILDSSETKDTEEDGQTALNIELLEQYREENLDILCQYFEKNPNVTFTVFVAPYSVAYWLGERADGKLEYWNDTLMALSERLTDYENVNLYIFTDDDWKEIAETFENYTDTQHYKSNVCEKMVECFDTGDNLITKQNYNAKVTNFINWIENYDAKALNN